MTYADLLPGDLWICSWSWNTEAWMIVDIQVDTKGVVQYEIFEMWGDLCDSKCLSAKIAPHDDYYTLSKYTTIVRDGVRIWPQ